ncbi:DUF805 domain-containing protein [Brevundimonas sp.]|uniref:DUF805 domain-containing protein n=1 Tax=Brevundimonas sp. TaxID=1871086 RepID=UPI003D6CE708
MLIAARLLGFKSTISEFLLVLVCIPRMHDMGWSGRWVFLPVAIEVIGVFWAVTLPPEQAVIVMGTITLMIAATMVWLGCLKGQAKWNQYGDPPPPGLAFRSRAASTH